MNSAAYCTVIVPISQYVQRQFRQYTKFDKVFNIQLYFYSFLRHFLETQIQILLCVIGSNLAFMLVHSEYDQRRGMVQYVCALRSMGVE
jgi:hypothetical protein